MANFGNQQEFDEIRKLYPALAADVELVIALVDQLRVSDAALYVACMMLLDGGETAGNAVTRQMIAGWHQRAASGTRSWQAQGTG
jgi:hypothetical protein